MQREDTTEDSLLAAPWQRVWQGFDRLASEPKISLVAVVIDGDGDPSAFIHELAARENRAHWQATPIRAVDGRPGEYQAAVASHRLFAFGEPETWEAFRVAAMRAGVLAKSVSNRLLPASVRDRISDLDRWAWAVFDVGWRKLNTVPFRAERWTRDDDSGAIQLELARTAGLYRGWYYSEIGNAVSASIDVVNVFRMTERVGHGSVAASPAKDDDTDAQPTPSIVGFVPAATLAFDYAIVRQRLSEAAVAGDVRTMPAPSGMKDSEGKCVRKLYNKADALRQCTPKWTKKKSPAKGRSTNS